MSAAMEIVRTDRTADITVLEKGKDYSYGQCGLPYVIGGLVPSTNDVIARSVNTFREKYGIDARIHTNVTKVDPDLQQVSGINLEDGSSFMIEYDRLLIATGVDSLAPDWQGIHLSGIHSLKTLQDTKQIKEDLTKEINEVTVVGGGYIGLEMAENFVHLDKKVRLIQRGKQLAPIFDKDMATIIEQKAKEKGIEIILEEEVQSFRGNHRVEAVETDKQTYTTDLVLLSIGVTPNTSFLKNTGIHRNDKGALVVNRYMQTSIPNVYAAGDCATQYHIVKQLDDHFPLGTTANKQGRIAGANMADHRLTFKGIVGDFYY
ncbi:pyridine nucleotide-disulfide oxidoreductase [Gracilibacillus boraciitolerans JCM 21714]|uniref:Pyridine nucleotide-disulfide oxidoreductase n=1 Tax=Gracilibacillus boraciitolerans JCM 21714 TaxID=1298598 RepID=W4VD35_9BACI|nr:pyridine nucleotide-disulfide oxidoreductase [Gracilibacillus boraciitolerans JCM 21714]